MTDIQIVSCKETVMSALVEMRTEIHSLHSRSLTPYTEDNRKLRAELEDCLARAEKLATQSPSDQALLRLLYTAIADMTGTP